MGDDGAVAVDQNGVSPLGSDRQNVRDKGADRDISGDNPLGVATLEWLGDGDDQTTVRDIGVGRSDDQFTGGNCILVPGALTGVIIGWQAGGGTLEHLAVSSTGIDPLKATGIHGLGQMADGFIFFGECFLGGTDHADAGIDPVGDTLDVGHGAFVNDAPDQSLGFSAQL
ncbi:hypothetical protein IIDPJIOB_01413 [Aeromonas veronii]